MIKKNEWVASGAFLTKHRNSLKGKVLDMRVCACVWGGGF